MAIMMSNWGFKIKSKADAEEFFMMKKGGKVSASEGEFYWTDGETDYRLEVGKNNFREVATRPVCMRGNIFNPYFIEEDPVSIIWKTRKYINKKWFDYSER